MTEAAFFIGAWAAVGALLVLNWMDERREAEAMRREYNISAAIMDYEDGILSVEKEKELFQYLVDTGMAWQLQGHYGRKAMAMIQAGAIKPGVDRREAVPELALVVRADRKR